MNKKKKITEIAAISMLMALGAVSVHAEATQDTTVSYDNSSEVTDGDPTYAVTVPTNIAIDETQPSTTFKVEAISKEAGKDIATVLGDKTLSVNITSKNSFKLKLNNADPVTYELSKTSMSLTKDAPSDTSTVTLKGIATQSGNHTDVLTFALTTSSSGA